MDYREETNNRVHVTGTILGEPEFSHEVQGEKFYQITVDCKRKSGVSDLIPVVISSRIVPPEKLKAGERIDVRGQFRSATKYAAELHRNRLLLFLFAQSVNPDDGNRDANGNIGPDMNRVTLHGYLCKDPAFRTTKSGRDITELLIAVNRQYGKSDYIPSIAWGRNANYTTGFSTGTELLVTGRFQSRVYHKGLEDGKSEDRTAYELSINTIDETGEIRE